APGEVRFVGAGVARVAAAGLAVGVAGKFQRGETGAAADVPGGDLVDGNARLDVAAGRFLHPHAGEEAAVGSRVVAGSVVARFGVLEVESGDHLDAVFERFERRQRVLQLEVRAGTGGRPVARDRAVREIEEGHAERRAAGGGGEAI